MLALRYIIQREVAATKARGIAEKVKDCSGGCTARIDVVFNREPHVLFLEN